jgi:hypothetical protein
MFRILHAGGKSSLGPLYDIDPHALLKQQIQVYWDGEKEFFSGTVTQFNADDWHHMVRAMTLKRTIMRRQDVSKNDPHVGRV